MNLPWAFGNVGEPADSVVVWSPSSELVEAADPTGKWIQNFPPPSTSRCEELGAIWRSLGLTTFASTDIRGMELEVLREYWSRMQLTSFGVLVRERGDRPAIFKSFEEIRGHFQFPALRPARQSYASIERPKEVGKWVQHMDAREAVKKPFSANKFVGAEIRAWMSWGVQWFRGNHHHGRYSKADLNVAWAIYSRQLQPLEAILGLLQRKSSQHGCTGAALAGHILAHPFADELKAQIRDGGGFTGSETEVVTVGCDKVDGVARDDDSENGSGRKRSREELESAVVETDGGSGRKRASEELELELAVVESDGGSGRKRASEEEELELELAVVGTGGGSGSGVAEQENATLARRKSAAAVLVALSRGESPTRAVSGLLQSFELSDACLRNGDADCVTGASTAVQRDDIGNGEQGLDQDKTEPDADGVAAEPIEVDDCVELDKEMDSDADFPELNVELQEVNGEKPLDAEAVPLEVVLELPSMETISEASSLGQPVSCCKDRRVSSREKSTRVVDCSCNESVDSCPMKTTFNSLQGAEVPSEKLVELAVKDLNESSPHESIQACSPDTVGDSGPEESPTDSRLNKTIVEPVTVPIDGLGGNSGDTALIRTGERLQAVNLDTARKSKAHSGRRRDWVDEFCMDTERLKQQLLSWERKWHSNPAGLVDP